MCTQACFLRLVEVDAILSGEDARARYCGKTFPMPTVFIIGKDWKLRSLVRAELREHGIEALGMETPQEAAQAVEIGRASCRERV